MHRTLRKLAAVGILLFGVVFMGAACTFKSVDGSILKTVNFGRGWESRSTLTLSDNRTAQLSKIDVTRIVFDPRNYEVVFLGTRAHGLFASNNGGASWIQLMPSQYVTDVAFDTTSQCILYVSTPSRLLKTINCGNTWEVILNESRQGVGLTSVAVDTTYAKRVYLTSSAGDLFRSNDGGVTWSTIYRAPEQSFKRVVIDPRNSRTLYVVGQNAHIVKSTDRGAAWTDIAVSLRSSFQQSLDYRWFDVLRSGRDRFFYASQSGLFVTKNGGVTWDRIPLLTPPGSVDIFAAHVHPRNEAEMYYVTSNTFYETRTAGLSWVARPLPTQKEPAQLLVHPTKPGVIYLGFRQPVDESQYWYTRPQEY